MNEDLPDFEAAQDGRRGARVLVQLKKTKFSDKLAASGVVIQMSSSSGGLHEPFCIHAEHFDEVQTALINALQTTLNRRKDTLQRALNEITNAIELAKEG